jgi:methylated-DNA-protein-cysteine methyltransferase-like protein
VQSIPAGRVATYGQVAAAAGRPGAARWVGRCLAAVPEGADVPWHRVVAATGRLALAGAAAAQQRRRLRAEGVSVDEGGRIDLRRHGWGRSG